MSANYTLTNTWQNVITGNTSSVITHVRKGKAEWFASPTQPLATQLGHPCDTTGKGDTFDTALAANQIVWMRSMEESTTATVVVTTSLELFGS